jgi:N,N'-diacetylchitobiose phosphorylase
MQYGYFDDVRREYVITRPDTPRSWINYLGSRLYGGIITQNAGGYSFYRSGARGRILRMRFNGVPLDQPGRYLYLRDDEDGDYWSASWQPVGKPLSAYACQVRHGLGYTVFEAEYGGIRTALTCFVPKGRAFECWWLRVTNPGSRTRRLSAFSYAELANDWHYKQDLENLQYSQYIVVTAVQNGIIHRKNNLIERFDQCYFGLAGGEVVSYDTDRDAFLGPYRTPANPLAVARGRCADSIAVGDNACASLHTAFELPPGDSRDLIFILGVGAPDAEWESLPPGRSVLAEYGSPERLTHELNVIRDEWAALLEALQVQTPDPELDSMINVWHAYQTHMTFNWSRGVSLIEAGGRDGLGYRDTVQDMLSVAHSIPAPVEERLDLILTGQTACGGAMPLITPLTHRPGTETAPDTGHYRSDDALWLPLTVANFVFETGNAAYLDKILPYADQGQGSVYEHLLQALHFSLNHRGAHGLMLGLAADWNDCIHYGDTGESLFSTFLFYAACKRVAELAMISGRVEDAAWCKAQAELVKACADAAAWDGEWYLRAISPTGKLGSRERQEGRLYLESNVWAVISGAADSERGRRAMDSVHGHLATEHGLVLCDPPHRVPDPAFNLSLLVFPPGHKENGGIFCHSNAWAIVAECILGRGDRAYTYYRSYLPARYNAQAEVRQAEPYVYSQFTHGKASPRFGESRNPWLTGTASWTYIAVTQYLLGVQPVMEGLRVDPCIPAAWDAFEMRRRFRGRWVSIRVENSGHVNQGVHTLTLNGELLAGNLIPADRLGETNLAVVALG